MLNRTQSPSFNPIGKINFIHPEKHLLKNQVPVYILNGGGQEMVKLEFIFNNVNFDPSNPLKTMAVSALLKNGTSKYSAKEIADAIDYYGAFLEAEYAADYITVTLHALRKHLGSVLPILHAVLNDSVFPQSELDIYQRNQKQKFQVSMQKNDFIARKAFAHELYGNTVYGADIQLEDYDRLTRADLLNYYNTAFVPQNTTVLMSGNTGDAEFALLSNIFGNVAPGNDQPVQIGFGFEPGGGRHMLIERPETIQSAIRMGIRAINRTHPDFPGLSVLNCVLGGYFGSRLMTNIREDKGYTYGIGSAVVSMKHGGHFFIATEVGAAVCDDAVKEIYKEIELLKAELIGADELNLVRNYMLGSLLGSLENVFSHMDKFKNLLFYGLGYDYYERYIETVKTISAEELQVLAVKYLRTEEFIELVVGTK